MWKKVLGLPYINKASTSDHFSSSQLLTLVKESSEKVLSTLFVFLDLVHTFGGGLFVDAFHFLDDILLQLGFLLAQ
jgi:hypothetical protein